MIAIIKYSVLILLEIIKRHLPEIKKGCQIFLEKAFLAFDFWATIAYELLDIAVLCLIVFIKWFVKTELCRELAKATVQTVTCPVASTKALISNIRRQALSAWTFRQELIREYALA